MVERKLLLKDVGAPFGEVLRRTAARLGVTQEELAERLGVGQSRVAEVFVSESITERLLDRYLAALGVQLEVRIIT